jgi:sulfide:quinone oxidoreductase
MIFGIKEYAETLEKQLVKYNIHAHYGANITAINGETKTIEFETKNWMII